ncbi:hypothetical protein BDA96_03G184100 [Sorghum bicolor]|uniref:Uncharacterized protein n=2 Tax=Sorghum bicolor TaxID=4558 RepID=A0A921UQC5_SORBI|nr:hypothetical protein BDA96_03G184100 [Sorghum bicolor]KXG32565.1 hypothetical protein SORBI_3003G169800 [Sorghum bicolor]
MAARKSEVSGERARERTQRGKECARGMRIRPGRGKLSRAPARARLDLRLPATTPVGKQLPPATLVPACNAPPSSSSSPPRPPPPCNAARREAPPAGKARLRLDLCLPATPPAGKEFPPATVLPACSASPSASSSPPRPPPPCDAAPPAVPCEVCPPPCSDLHLSASLVLLCSKGQGRSYVCSPLLLSSFSFPCFYPLSPFLLNLRLF